MTTPTLKRSSTIRLRARSENVPLGYLSTYAFRSLAEPEALTEFQNSSSNARESAAALPAIAAPAAGALSAATAVPCWGAVDATAA